MIACELCGANPATDSSVALIRQNPMGEIGIWRCQLCNKRPVDNEVQDIIDTVLEDNRESH